MVVCRLSEERTLAHQQARRRSQTVSGPRGNAISISGSSRVLRRGLGERHVLGSRGSTRRLRTGLLLGVCSWWRCSRDSCIPRRQNTQEIIHIHSSAFLGLGCRCSNLHGAAVALLPWLQEGISADRSAEDAIGGGGVQQTGRVDLLQEPVELLPAAATEQLRVHHARREQEDSVDEL